MYAWVSGLAFLLTKIGVKVVGSCFCHAVLLVHVKLGASVGWSVAAVNECLGRFFGVKCCDRA